MGLTAVRSGSKSKDGQARLQRKLEKKSTFYRKVQDTVAEKSKAIQKKSKTKSKLRSRQKKLKAYDLSALSEFLPDLETLTTTKSDTTKEAKVNCKSRQTLVQRESARMQAVFKDPSFMKNPFEAIHKQLLEMQPPEQEVNRSAYKGKRKEKKKRGKKAKSRTQDMEI